MKRFAEIGKVKMRMGNLSIEALPTKELVKIALKNIDSNDAALAISVMQQRGTIEEFETARKLSKSIGAKTRQLSIRILGQLEYSDRYLKDEILAILLEHLMVPNNKAEILADACVALGHIHDARSIPYLYNLSSHHDACVRYGIAFAMMGHEDPLAIEALIRLSADTALKVKDWATYGLSKKIDANTQEIRDALFANVYDEDLRVRGEALVGLARRNDLRVAEPLTEEISHEFPGYLALEAVAILKDPAFYTPLMELSERTAEFANIFYQEKLEIAVEACALNRLNDIPNMVHLPEQATELPPDVQDDYHEIFVSHTSGIADLYKDLEDANIIEIPADKTDDFKVPVIEFESEPKENKDIIQFPNAVKKEDGHEKRTSWRYYEQRDITSYSEQMKLPPEITETIKKENIESIPEKRKSAIRITNEDENKNKKDNARTRSSASFDTDKNKKLNNANENKGQFATSAESSDSSWLKHPTYRCTIVKPFFIPTSPNRRPNA